MDSANLVDLSREGIVLSLKIGGPILLIAIAVGLVVSVFQAMTQIQDQTLSFVPRIAAMLLALLYLLPWGLTQLVEYSTQLITSIPGRI